MNSTYVEGADGKPRVIRHEHVGLGLAVDVEKSDGSRSLLVPVIRDADTLDFRAFWGTLRGDHPQGPLQQAHRRRLRRRHRHPHQPRHHRHQAVGAPAHARPGRHRRRGRHRLPGRVARRRPRACSPTSAPPRSSRSPRPTTTASSRAPSPGMFLKRVEELLLGADGFYDDIFASLGVPYEADQVAPRRQPARPRARADAREADGGGHAHPRLPGAGPPHRRPRSAAVERAAHGARARPRHLRAHHLGPRPRVPHRRRSAGSDRMASSARSCGCCATPTAAPSASSTCTSRTSTSSTGSRSRSRARASSSSTSRTSATSSSASTPPRRSRSSSAPSGSARSGSASRAARA